MHIRNASLKESIHRRFKSKVHYAHVMEDLFNNRVQRKESDKGIKLRLSHAASFLWNEWKEDVDTFLKKNPALQAKLDAIPPAPSTEGDSLFKKVSTYLQWLKLIKEQEGETADLENEPHQPYLAVHREEKDDELKQLYEKQQQFVLLAQSEKKRHIPNYYYLLYSETYPFN